MGRRTGATYRHIQFVADAEGLSATARGRIRLALTETIASLRAETQDVEAAASGPDPEYGVYLLTHFLAHRFPNILRALDRALASVR